MKANEISFMDPEIQKCPYSAYKTVRESGPVFQDPATGWYFITDYDLVKKLTADTDKLSSFTGILMCKQKSEIQDEIDRIFSQEGFPQVPALVVQDPPDHKFHRSFVDKAFTPGRVKQMEDYLESIVDEMIDQFIDQDEVDIKSELAVKVPLAIIADQVGVPRGEEDLPTLKRWTDAVISNQDQSLSGAKQIELAKTICEMHRYAAEKVEEFRKEPRECLLSDFANHEVNGRKLTMEEIAALIEQVLAGGNDSTANAIGNCIIRLIEQPELQDQLREDPLLTKQFIEEVLRLDAPIQGLFREPKEDLEIEGVKIPKGSVVVLKWAAANRDPDQFPEPDRIDLSRKNSNRHMTFGFGAHICVGNQLARGEIRITLNKLLSRAKNIRYARGENSVVREPHFFAYGPKELHITFDRI